MVGCVSVCFKISIEKYGFHFHRGSIFWVSTTTPLPPTSSIFILYPLKSIPPGLSANPQSTPKGGYT